MAEVTTPIDDDEPLLTVTNANSNSSQRCPTCQGTGSVAQSPGLVALIPLDDKRLKRRHTLLYIIITVIFCTIIAAITILTILPRSVHLTIKNPLVIDSTNDTFRNTTVFHLLFVHQTRIHSDNWVPIRLVNLTATVEHQLLPLNTNSNKNYSHKMYIRPLGTLETNLTVRLNFDSTTMAYRVCKGEYRQMLMFKLQTILTYADFLLGRIQTATDVSYQYVLCNRGDWLVQRSTTEEPPVTKD